MGRKRMDRRWLLFLMAILATVMITVVYAAFAQTADPGPPNQVLFTSISYAQDTGTTAAKTDLSKCIITLAYIEFLVDGKYHTPKVTITYQGKKLKKNEDYKLAFSGGKEAGNSSVKITGIGSFTGVVTKTYRGIPPETKATTTVKKTTTATKKTTTKKTTAAAKKTTKAAKATTSTTKAKSTSSANYSPTAAREPATKVTLSEQSLKAITSYTFSDTGKSMNVGAKVSSGLGLNYKSSNPSVVSVDAKGVMRAKKAGKATITIRQDGNDRYKPVSRTVSVTVPSFRNRQAALAPWRHVLIDTFFHINGRKYSRDDPGKYWTGSGGKWSGKTGKKGNTQSCVTLSTVSLKRLGLLPANSGCIWLSSNHGKSPNKTVRLLRKNSKRLSISYPHKSLKTLAGKDLIRYGDILCRSGHTFIYMGKDSGGHPLIYECGSQRDIGNGTCVVWGHHSGGHADKLTGKINKQITHSNAVGKKWRQGKLSDDAFKGHRASGKNLNEPVHVVCSIRTFKIRTTCINGTITPGNVYMAGENATIKFSSPLGKHVEYVRVDGKNVKAKSSYTFKKIKGDHSVVVKYKT